MKFPMLFFGFFFSNVAFSTICEQTSTTTHSRNDRVFKDVIQGIGEDREAALEDLALKRSRIFSGLDLSRVFVECFCISIYTGRRMFGGTSPDYAYPENLQLAIDWCPAEQNGIRCFITNQTVFSQLTNVEFSDIVCDGDVTMPDPPDQRVPPTQQRPRRKGY